VQDLKVRTSESLQVQEEKTNALRRAERELKNLTSELNAVRGNRHDSNSILMDGFEDEAAHESNEPEERIQLRRLEGLYEKLKTALIARDARIEELEAQTASPESSPDLEPTGPEPVSTTTQNDQTRLSEQAAVIESLEGQLSELRQEKEMLEDLASRRSRSNRALKDASAEMEAKVPMLEQEISTRDETIAAREGSIKRFLNEAEQARKDIADRDASIEALRSAAEAKDQALALNKDQQDALEAAVNAREERITQLDSALTAANGRISKLTTEVEHAQVMLTDLQTSIEQKDEVARQQDQTRDTLQSTLRERDSLIESLNTELRAREQAVNAGAEQQVTLQASLDAREQRITVLDADLAAARGDAEVLRTELDQARSSLGEQAHELDRQQAAAREHAQTEEALKNTLRDREFQLEHLSSDNSTLEARLNEAREASEAAERKLADTLQQAADSQSLSEKRQQAVDSERTVSQHETEALKREIEDLKTSLVQHEEWMDRLKVTLGERENRSRDQQQTIETLQTELDTANGRLASGFEERQSLENARHELDRQITTLSARIEQAEAELVEQAQSVTMYRNMLADQDRICSLRRWHSRMHP
jgi:chromosome segregation ATPase